VESGVFPDERTIDTTHIQYASVAIPWTNDIIEIKKSIFQRKSSNIYEKSCFEKIIELL